MTLAIEGPSPGAEPAAELHHMVEYAHEEGFGEMDLGIDERHMFEAARRRPKAPPSLLPALGALTGLQARGCLCRAGGYATPPA